jgi:hypothetical protein
MWCTTQIGKTYCICIEKREIIFQTHFGDSQGISKIFWVPEMDMVVTINSASVITVWEIVHHSKT